MRYSLYVKDVDWQKVVEYRAKDNVDALVQAARSMLPKHHDMPIIIWPDDEPLPAFLTN